MRFYSLLTLFIIVEFIFFSCTDNKTISSDKIALEDSINQIEGNWISYDYIEHVKRTKSPYLAKAISPPILFFNLNRKELFNKIGTLHGFTDKEGGYDANIKFDLKNNLFVARSSKKENYSPFDEYFEIKPIAKDKLEIFFPNQNKGITYQKLTTSSIEEELCKVLFTGGYIEKKTGNRVAFTNNGVITGFKNYGTYNIVYTFGDEFAELYDSNNIVWLNDKNNLDKGDAYFFKIIERNLELELLGSSKDSPNLRATGKKYFFERGNSIE